MHQTFLGFNARLHKHITLKGKIQSPASFAQCLRVEFIKVYLNITTHKVTKLKSFKLLGFR